MGALLVLVLWGGLDCIRVIGDGYSLIKKHYATCPTELYILEGVRAVANQRPLYPEIDGPPYIFRLYHPLTYALVGYYGRLVGDTFEDFNHALLVSRVPAFVAAFLLIGVLTFYVYRRFDSPLLALLVPVVLLLLHSSTLSDFVRNRPETPALLFTFSGWVLAQLRPRRWQFYAAALFVVALLFKQTFFIAPLAVLIQLLLAKEYAALKKACLALFIFGALGLAWAIGAHGEGYFTHTFFSMASNPMNPVLRSLFFYSNLLHKHWGYFILGLFFVSAVWLIWRRESRELLIYALLSFLWASWSSGKEGSGSNYFCELSILLVLIAISAVGDLYRRRSRLILVPLGLIGLFLAVNLVQHGYGWNRVCFDRTHPTPGCADADRSATSPMERHAARYRRDGIKTLVFHEELALRLGQPQILDMYLVSLLVKAGFLQDYLRIDAIEASIAARAYRRVVFPRQLNPWTRRWLETAVRRGYRGVEVDRRLIELRLPP